MAESRGENRIIVKIKMLQMVKDKKARNRCPRIRKMTDKKDKERKVKKAELKIVREVTAKSPETMIKNDKT